MFVAFALLIAVSTPEPEAATLPMDIGPAAARRFENYVMCISKAMYERRSDSRATHFLAAEVRANCAKAKARAGRALATTYVKKPSLLSAGEAPDTKAARLLQTWDVRIEWVIEHGREYGSAR